MIRKTRWPPWNEVCVSFADRKNKMAAKASDWLTHFQPLLKPLNGTQGNLKGPKCSLPSLCFSGGIWKTDGGPGLLLAETFSTYPLKPLNEIQQNLKGIKISTSSTKFVFFRPNWKIRWPPWPLIGLDIFDFSSETAQRNSTTLDRKQDLNVLYQVFVFRLDRKNKMAALASDWRVTHLGRGWYDDINPSQDIVSPQTEICHSGSDTSSCLFFFFPFLLLAGLQSNSGLWIDDVRPSVNILVNLCVLSLFSVTIISINSIPCIDFDEISLTVTFPCDSDLDFFCSRSLNNFG